MASIVHGEVAFRFIFILIFLFILFVVVFFFLCVVSHLVLYRSPTLADACTRAPLIVCIENAQCIAMDGRKRARGSEKVKEKNCEEEEESQKKKEKEAR